MAGGIGLYSGPKLREEAFLKELHRDARYVLFECLTDDGQPQGLGLGEITRRYKGEPDGVFVQLRYLQVQDAYYRHWVESQGDNYRFHHFCRRALSSCERKLGKKEVVHIQRFAVITFEDVERILKEWKLKPLRDGKDVYRGRALEEEKPPGVSAKIKAKKSSPREDEDAYGLHTPDFDSSPEPEEPPSRPARKKETEGRPSGDGSKGRSARDKEKERSDSRRPRRRDVVPREHPSGVDDRKGKDKAMGKSPLDAMVDADELEGKVKPNLEIDTELLRKKLGDYKNREAKGNASDVLATRIAREAEAGGRAKKKTSDERVLEAVRKLASRKRRRSNSRTSTEDSGIEDDVMGAKAGGDLAYKQRKLKKLSEERPGALLTRGYAVIHEQLGTLFGSGSSGSRDTASVLQPGALRYLLTCALPLVNTRMVGEQRLRELRTLATSLDLVVAGKATEAADYLMQRYKSILMAMRDGSDAASRFLELIPGETYPTGATEGETHYARSAAYQQAKSEAVMKKELSVEENESRCGQGQGQEEEPLPFTQGDILWQGGARDSPTSGRRGQGGVDEDEGGEGSLPEDGRRIEVSLENKDVQDEEGARGEGRQEEGRMTLVRAREEGTEEKHHDAGPSQQPPVVAGDGGDLLRHGQDLVSPFSAFSRSPVATGSSNEDPYSRVSLFDSLRDEGSLDAGPPGKWDVSPADSVGGMTRKDNPRRDHSLDVSSTKVGQLVGDEFLQLLQVECGDISSFIQLCSETQGISACNLQLAVATLQLLLRTPLDGAFLKHWIQFCKSSTTTLPSRSRDVLPMPLPPVGAAIQLLKLCRKDEHGLILTDKVVCSNSRTGKRQKLKKIVTEGAHQLWRVLSVGVLNGLTTGWDSSKLVGGTYSEAQKLALGNIDKLCRQFNPDPLQLVQLPNFGELLKSKTLDYSGDEVSQALPLKLGEILPGLPEQGIAGSLRAVEAADSQVKAWVEDPRLTLKDEADWPAQVPQAKINAKREDWYEISCTLLKMGIFETIRKEDIFAVQGQMVLNGAFAIEKKPAQAHVREPCVIRMGAQVDGVEGVIHMPNDKKAEVGWFTLWLLGRRMPATKGKLMVLGRWVRCFEFRRPLMCLLNDVWPRGAVAVRCPLRWCDASELLRCVAVSALASTDLRAAIDNEVTVSDASTAGGGLCCSGALTEVGQDLLKQLQSPQVILERLTPFSAQGAMVVAILRTRPPGDDMISFTDFVAAVLSSTQCKDGLCRSAFRIFDRNADGYIDVSELEAVLRKGGGELESPTESRTQATFTASMLQEAGANPVSLQVLLRGCI
eukprot:Skav200561  [mRNA]  locus=scaffold2256:136068:151169:+ [translate_table: standard]